MVKYSITIGSLILFLTTISIATNSPSSDAKIPISNANGLKGSLKVLPTGQAYYSIPIDAPLGTAGMTPALSFIYDSSNSNTRNGLLGMGFSLKGLTAITRCPANRSQNGLIHSVDFSDQDKFCLNGEQLVAIKGMYGADGTEYRTYVDSKVKIISYGRKASGPASFKVWTKGGQVAEYGVTIDSQITGQGKDTVALWGINRIQDRAGNYAEVRYFKDESQGSFYPIEINYTGNEKAKLAPYNSIKFIYEDRPDTKITYQAGSKITLNKRLKAVQNYQNSNLVDGYRLTYEISKNTFRSRITAIQKCNSSDVCLPPIKFEWQTNDEGWELSNFVLPADVLIDEKNEGIKILDINGDGLPDIIQEDNKNPRKVWINTGEGWSDNTRFILPTGILGNEADISVRVLDLNGDGLPDIIKENDRTRSEVWINTGEEWSYVDDIKFILPVNMLLEGKDEGVRFLDLNGDGLSDIVQTIPVDEIRWKDPSTSIFGFNEVFEKAEQAGDSGRNPRGCTIVYDVENSAFIYEGDKLDRKFYSIWINNKNTWTKDSNIDVSSPIWIAPYDRGIIFLDLNGDGLADLTCGVSIGSDEQRKTWINKGNGWKESSNFILPANMLNNGRDTGLRFLDLNGDGLLDIIQSYTDANKNEVLEAWLNTGEGWIKLDKDSGFIPPTSIVDKGQDLGVRILDLNGDGLPDIVQKHVDSEKKEIHGVWLNTEKGWVDTNTTSFNLPRDISRKVDYWLLHLCMSLFTTEPDIVTGMQFLDLNGDGLPDFIQSTSIDEKIVQKAYLNKAHGLPDYLISITDGFGTKLDIEYKSLSDKNSYVYTKEHDAKYPNMDWQGSMYVVSKTVNTVAPSDPKATDKLAASIDITTYHYTGAKFNHLGLGFLGFHKVSSINQQTNINTTTTYSQDVDLHNKDMPVVVETKLPDGTLVSSLQYYWYLKTFGNTDDGTAYFSPYVMRSIRRMYGHNGVLTSSTTTNNTIDKSTAISSNRREDYGILISTTTTNNTVDKYGNPTTISSDREDYTDNHINSIKIFSGAEETLVQKKRITTTINAYYSDPKKWVIGELLATKVTNTAPDQSDKIKTSVFSYDPETSLLVQVIDQPNDPKLARTTKFERDIFGNIVRTAVFFKDKIEPKVTNYHYDDFARLVGKTNSDGTRVDINSKTDQEFIVINENPNVLIQLPINDLFAMKKQKNTLPMAIRDKE